MTSALLGLCLEASSEAEKDSARLEDVLGKRLDYFYFNDQYALPEPEDMEALPGLTSVAATYGVHTFMGGATNSVLNIIPCAPNYFELKRMTISSGTYDLSEQKCVVGHEVAALHPLGSRIHVGSGLLVTVAGVLEPRPAYLSDAMSDYAIFISRESANLAGGWASDGPDMLFLELADLDLFLSAVESGFPNRQAVLTPEKRLYDHDIRLSATLANVVALFTLLAWIIAASILISVRLMDFEKTMREAGLRLAVGASKLMLWLESAYQSFLFSGAGALGGVFIAALMAKLNGGSLSFASAFLGLGVATTMGVITTLFGAGFLLRANIQDALNVRSVNKKHVPVAGFVAVFGAFLTMVATGSSFGIGVGKLQHLLSQIKTQATLFELRAFDFSSGSLKKPPEWSGREVELIRAYPGVVDATRTSGFRTNVLLDDGKDASLIKVDQNYFSVMGFPLKGELPGPGTCVCNGFAGVGIGDVLRLGDSGVYTVAGVCDDFEAGGFPCVYLSLSHEESMVPSKFGSIFVRASGEPGKTGTLEKELSELLHSWYPEYEKPKALNPVRQIYEKVIPTTKKWTVITLFLAVSIGLLETMAMIELLSYDGIRRKKEVGLRKALGEPEASITRDIVAERIFWIGSGGIIGFLSLLAFSVLYRSGEGMEARIYWPWALAVAAGTLAAYMVLAILFSRRLIRPEPADLLISEE
ncbi:MAG: ABC transporter permease [Spirochaetales bacterium]|nr:ABC transporter permease [Spirochaetales bacterium]